MVSGRRSGEPVLQGRLKLVLVVLAASLLDAGRVPIVAHSSSIEAAVEGGLTHGLKFFAKSPKFPKELKPMTKGLRWGVKFHKYENKVKDHMTPPAPGSTTVLVDRISIEGGSLAVLPVVWADITAQATAGIVEGGGCASQTQKPIRATSISLFGTGGAGQLGHLLGATYWAACPVPATGAAAVLGLGRGGELASKFSTFSYLVSRGEGLSNTQIQVWLGPQQPQRRWPAGPTTIVTLSSDPRLAPNLYYVPFTGIQIGARPGLLLAPQPGIGEMYLSTGPFTYLEKNLYARLKSALLFRNVNVNPVPPQRRDQLCYRAGSVDWRSLPTIAILFGNAPAMVVDWNNLWYKDGPNSDCLAILPSPDQMSVLGGFLQSGRMMTISRQFGRTTYTLTF